MARKLGPINNQYTGDNLVTWFLTGPEDWWTLLTALWEKRVIVATREIAALFPSSVHAGLSIHIRDEGLQLNMSDCGDMLRLGVLTLDSISYPVYH